MADQITANKIMRCKYVEVDVVVRPFSWHH